MGLDQTMTASDMAIEEEVEKIGGVVQASSSSLEDHEASGSNQAPSNKPKKGSRLRRLLWDSLDKSPEERAFVNKADWFIMSYVCIAYFVKYLDQTNVS